jgi:histidine triad (HIT) family protein
MKEIPANIVFENDNVLAFLDINPVNKGHVLLIPKEHFETYFDTPDDLLSEMAPIVKNLGNAVKKASGCDFCAISVYGLDVPHLHIHVIPRFFDDGLKTWPSKKYADNEEMDSFRKLIVENL